MMTLFKGLGTFIVSVFALLILGSVVHAQSSGIPADRLGSLLTDGMSSSDFGYINSNVSVKNITSSSIVIESPIILDADGEDIKEYVMRYGLYPMDKLLDGGSDVSIDDFNQKEFTFSSFSGTTFTMTLTTADDIQANQIYYISVQPFNADGEGGQISGPDVCFRLQDAKDGFGSECSGSGTGGILNAAGGANMNLADVSHTRYGNNITLRWTDVAGAPKVEIYLLNGTTQVGTKLATKNMSDETFTFPLTVQSPQIVRLKPVTANGTASGTEKDYTMKELLGAATPSTPTQPGKPGIPRVPTVGPKENILFILFMSMVVYGLVRFVRSRKRA